MSPPDQAAPASGSTTTTGPIATSNAAKLAKDILFPPKSTRKQSPNNAGLPSLKQLSDRLHATPAEPAITTASAASTATGTPAAAPAAPSKLALTDVTVNTTNLPVPKASAVLSPSRLKLPQSAMQRANISPPSPVRELRVPEVADADNKAGEAVTAAPAAGDNGPASSSSSSSSSSDEKTTANGKDKANKDATTGSSSESRLDSESKDPTMASPPSSLTDSKTSTPASKEMWRRSGTGRTILGFGFPGAATASSPATPSRPAPATADGDVPDIVVESSTPTKDSPSEDTATEATKPAAASVNVKGEYPLAHPWTLFYDSKTAKPDPASVNKDSLLNEWEASLVTVGTIETVQGFARHMNNVRVPSVMVKGSNYHLFKDGIRPMWEDPANQNGGKWVILVRTNPAVLDVAWANLSMALVGEILDPEDGVCGIVASARPKMDRIQIWTRSRDNIEYLNTLASRIVEFMGLDQREMESVSLEFQGNGNGGTPAAGVLTRIPFARAVSVGSSPVGDRLPRSRNPSSPVLPPSPLGAHSLLVPSGGAMPMRRTGSGGVSGGAFSGPMGTPRRLVSTPASGGA